MRLLTIILGLLLVFVAPASAQNWTSYANARYGATADVPPGFAPEGPEAHNSDGLRFQGNHGSAILTIFGADVPGRNFEAKIKDMMGFDHSYSNWTISGSTITNSWAEYSGSIGGNQLRVRVEASCDGRQLVAAKFEYNGNLKSVVDRVFASLKAGPANSCKR